MTNDIRPFPCVRILITGVNVKAQWPPQNVAHFHFLHGGIQGKTQPIRGGKDKNTLMGSQPMVEVAVRGYPSCFLEERQQKETLLPYVRHLGPLEMSKLTMEGKRKA